MVTLALAHGLNFCDLYENSGLQRIDNAFIDHLSKVDDNLSQRLLKARSKPDEIEDKESSDLFLEMAPHVDDFLGHLFGIESEIRELAERHHELAPIFACKRLFVQRQAAKKIKADEAISFDGTSLWAQLEKLIGKPFDQLSFSKTVMTWLDDESKNAEALDLAKRYAAWAFHTEAGKKLHQSDVLFRGPEKIDFLIPGATGRN